MLLDPVHELVLKFIKQTNRPIFLTGKAGTGKTTFLHYIKTTTDKNFAVVAPTAVAAINAGGVTINSFFQMPPQPYIPENEDILLRNLVSQDKLKVLQSLDLLIIDEVSMVRADTVDYIDAVLKQVRGSIRPFGGVKILMIGDLYQLPPVYQRDWYILVKFYKGPYFFDSQILKNFAPITFELNTVYRQSDPTFIKILNNVRNGHIEDDELFLLNKCYDPELRSNWLKNYVTLSTHNQFVNNINQLRLDELESSAFTYKAIVTGDFKKEAYPAEEELVLKKGAQVMFIKNDSSGKKQYYNGRTARISEIDYNRIELIFLDDNTQFEVVPEVWNNVKYSVANNSSKIDAANNGSFTQYPLRLAWAITIHKSQGLTFEKAIIDVDAAFAHGQSYVALSRCKSLEGMVLKSPVRKENILTDPQVIDFMVKSQQTVPDEGMLEKLTTSRTKDILSDIFDFSILYKAWEKLKPFYKIDGTTDTNVITKWSVCQELITVQINNVAQQFVRKEIQPLSEQSNSWIEGQSRIIKAASYFLPKLVTLTDRVNELLALTSSWDLPVEYYPALSQFSLNLKMKNAAFLRFPIASSEEDILSAVRETTLDFRPVTKNWNIKSVNKEKEITNPLMYKELINWRKETSARRGIPDYTLLSEKVLKDIAQKLPKSLNQLAAIKNFGGAKAADFGEDIIRIIRSFIGENELF